MSDPDPRLLPPFVVLAEELHFGRAAARLHLTQSALTQQVQRLERQLGTRLFDRDSHGVDLTPAGHAFLAGARGAVELARQAAAEARRAGGTQTRLRLGVDIHCPDPWVRRLRRFGTSRPDVELRLVIQQQDDVVRDVRAGRLDLGVGWTAPPDGDTSVDWAPLVPVPLHGVVRDDDPLARRERLPRADLTGRCLVLYRPTAGTRAFYDSFLAALTDPAGRRPSVTHVPVLDDAQAAMLDAVEAGRGVSLCPAGELDRRARPRLVALPFDPPIDADLVALWPRGRPPVLLPDLRSFLRR
ncbi:LysR family transcriptional regulator [Geodermatophilus sp. SYSU D01045]